MEDIITTSTITRATTSSISIPMLRSHNRPTDTAAGWQLLEQEQEMLPQILSTSNTWLLRNSERLERQERWAPVNQASATTWPQLLRACSNNIDTLVLLLLPQPSTTPLLQPLLVQQLQCMLSLLSGVAILLPTATSNRRSST